MCRKPMTKVLGGWSLLLPLALLTFGRLLAAPPESQAADHP